MFHYTMTMMSDLMTMEWLYLKLLDDGRLYDEDGCCVYPNAPHFSSLEEAEQWLIDNDERGTITESEL